MGHDEGDSPPVATEEYRRQLFTIGRFAGWVGLLLVVGFLCTALYLVVSGSVGPGFYWALFLVLYGGCIIKAAEEQKKAAAA